MTAKELYHEAIMLGLRLLPDGDALLVIPAKACPPEFANVLRQHKPQLLAFLESKRCNLPPDCAPWLHIAKQVMAGEFDRADSSMVGSLTIGLRAIGHPLCRAAIERLPDNPEKPGARRPDNPE